SADEEQSLFPRLRAQPPFANAESTPMDCMESEHVGHGDLMAKLKLAVVKRDAAKAGHWAVSIVREYRTHIRKEEDILYPMARELLIDPAEIAIMTEEMVTRRKKAGLIGC
ncbi:MAG: iron-sulfur cluster repair protein YtfE (RIC family), partial [Pseudohongiellaceae bacterium]